MAQPVLRRITFKPTANVTWQTAVPAIGANRALVVSKLVIAYDGTSASTFYLNIGVAANSGNNIAQAVSISPGQTYTETGLIVPTGELLSIYVTANFGNFAITVFGEEVDN